MPRAIRLFVSSSPDLGLERELLGQAIADLPISSGWEIKHTPSLTQALIKFLLDHAEHLGLDIDDVERLLSDTANAPMAGHELPDTRHGAGQSGVIFERDSTSGSAQR